MATDAEAIRDLTRAKVAFQLRTIEAIVTAGGQACRWCGQPSIRWTPCSCERAQEEARRIRADHR